MMWIEIDLINVESFQGGVGGSSMLLSQIILEVYLKGGICETLLRAKMRPAQTLIAQSADENRSKFILTSDCITLNYD